MSLDRINKLAEKYEFRTILKSEAKQTVEIEQICFPPNEACSEKHMNERVNAAPEMFLVAIDKQTGKIAAFINGLSTNEDVFRDEFFTEVSLYNPNGKNIMILGVDVLPEHRMIGLATELMRRYVLKAKDENRKALFLTCLADKVEMYKKMGYEDKGISGSTWGGEEWHDMLYILR